MLYKVIHLARGRSFEQQFSCQNVHFPNILEDAYLKIDSELFIKFKYIVNQLFAFQLFLYM